MPRQWTNYSYQVDDLFPPPAEPRLDASASPLAPYLSAPQTPLKAILDFLNRGLSASAGGAKALVTGAPVLPAAMRGLAGTDQTTYDAVLEALGVPDTPYRRGLGLVGDVTLDPANLVAGLGLPTRLKKFLAASPAATALRGSEPGRWLESLFRVHPGTPEAYRDVRRLLSSQIDVARTRAARTVGEDLFKGLKPEEAEAVLRGVEHPTQLPAHLAPFLAKHTAAMSAQAKKEIAAGVLDPNRLITHKGYVPYLFTDPVSGRLLSAKTPPTPALTANLRFARPRHLQSIDDALAQGAVPDIRLVDYARLSQGDRAILVSQFFRRIGPEMERAGHAAKVTNRIGQDVPDLISGALSQGFTGRVHVAAPGPLRAFVDQWAFSPAIARDLQKLVDPDTTLSLGRKAFIAANGVWRSYATSANPGFHFRNLSGNIFNSMLGDMRAADVLPRYTDARQAITRSPTFLTSKVGSHTGTDVVQAMSDLGVTGIEFGHFRDLRQLASASSFNLPARHPALSMLNPLSQDFLPIRMGREVGTGVENLSRAALFIDQVRKGRSFEQAALHVKKYLFDYSELTDFERGLRDWAVPFYTFTRKNLPVLFEGLIGRPHVIGGVGKVMSSLERATQASGLRVAPEDRPVVVQERMAQLPTQTTAGEYVFLDPRLPVEDLNVIPTPNRPNRWWQELVSRITPLMRAPLELGSNIDLQTGRRIYNEAQFANVSEARIPAPTWISVLAEHSAGFRSFAIAKLGLQQSPPRRGSQAAHQWTMPAYSAYALSQIPMLTNLGRTQMRTEADLGPLEGVFKGPVPIRPTTLRYYAGIGTAPYSPQQLAQARRSRRRKAVSLVREQARQRAERQRTQEDLDHQPPE